MAVVIDQKHNLATELCVCVLSHHKSGGVIDREKDLEGDMKELIVHSR